MFLRQSTVQTVLFGPCVDKDNGVTEETGLTLAQADMRLSKNGGSFLAKSAAGNATHDSDGWYSTLLSTTDTNTVGILKMNVHQPANMLPVWETFYVVASDIYLALFNAGSAAFADGITATVKLRGITHASAVIPTVTVVTNQVTADATAINGDAVAAANLQRLMGEATVLAQVNDASATTTAFAADQFTEDSDDHFNGRLITFATGALAGQQTEITGYDAAGGAQGSQEFTVVALTEAPGDGDWFLIT